MKKNKVILPVSKEDAYLHAIAATAKSIAAGQNHLQAWRKAKIAAKPLEIFDMNGTLLFYDYDAVAGKETVGTIRTAASRQLANTVISFRFGARKWDPEVSKAAILAIVKKNYRGYKVTSTLLVCYSYPKIGLMVNLLTADKKAVRIIFDISDYAVIPEKEPKADTEGSFAWSFLDSQDNKMREANMKRFAILEKGRTKIKYESGGITALKKYSLEVLVDINKFVFSTVATKELQFCTHYNYNETASHHCFVLHAQQVNDYCAVATCQMILCYYRYYYSQDQIAPALGYTSGGGCPSDQSPGYESLSNNHINGTFDGSATWEKARDQINLLQPLKSGISGHARACSGYSYHRQSGFSIDEKKLYIYDPWPWNANLKAGGDVYWEDWDSINHTNFVKTNLIY